MELCKDVQTPKVFGSQFKQNLPKQPVPPLSETLEKYFKTLQPFLNDSELANTRSLIEEFKSGTGPQLQKLLEEKARRSFNWLADWWVDVAYLEPREPIVIHKSPGLTLLTENFNNEEEKLDYTAKLILAALDFKSAIDRGSLPVETLGGEPLDMSQYTKFFGSCRIPGSPRDTLEFNSDSQHIVVVINNNFFKLPVITNEGKFPTLSALVNSLQNIVDQSEPTGPAVGVLTTENRDNWASAYQHLITDQANLRSVREIQSSLFLICLDNPPPKYCGNFRNTAVHQMVHGGGIRGNSANRWFDKIVQFAIGENGLIGVIYEHTPIEGQPIASMSDYLLDYIENGNSSQVASSNAKITPEKLFFNIDETLEDAIKVATKNLEKLIANLDVESFVFSSFGKELVKSQKLSPDSFIQMAIQYAFYRLYKVPSPQYEAGGMRRFLYGRTETIRSCSNEAVTFAKTMLNPSESNFEKVAALKLAINTHKKYVDEALHGFGVDRHLLGLKLIAIENELEIPKLYTDPAFTRSTHMRLRTSQVFTKGDGVMCWGPQVWDGYVCCYNPRPNDIIFALSAYEPQGTTAVKFRKALEDSLEDMRKVLTHNAI